VEVSWNQAELGLAPEAIATAFEHLKSVKAEEDPNKILCLQTVFLELLQLLNINEDTVRQHGAVMVLENFARVSRAIGDFQTINFRMPSDLQRRELGAWLTRIAATRYDDSGDLRKESRGDAVVISTVHAAKGLEWPVVFVPALRKGRFPSRPRVQEVWEIIPPGIVNDPQRYYGRIEDERRLFYTAITRSKRYLFFTTDTGYSEPSEFFKFVAKLHYVDRTDKPDRQERHDTNSPYDDEIEPLDITITELKYHELCPHQFKLRYLYGFSPPIVEDIGFGDCVHNACSEIHKRAILGQTKFDDEDVAAVVKRHIHLPYASDRAKAAMENSLLESISAYVKCYQDTIDRTVLSEKTVSFKVGNVTVHGRIDLVTRNGDQGFNIAEIKTAKDRETRKGAFSQLHLVSLGCEALIGEVPTTNEIIFVREDIQRESVPIDESVLDIARSKVLLAADGIRDGVLSPHLTLKSHCKSCDGRFVCPTWQRNTVETEISD